MTESLNVNPRATARNAVSSYVALLLATLIGIVLTPIMLSQLGTTNFGIWALILGTMSYLALLEAGLGIATTTRVAATEAEGPQTTSRVVSTALTLCMYIGVGCFVLTLALCAAFPILFDVPAETVDSARIAFLLVGVGQAFGFIALIFSATLIGTGHMIRVNIGGFVIAGLTAVAQGAALLSGGGLEVIGALQLAGALLTVIVLRLQVRRALPSVRLGPSGFHRPTARRLFQLGWRNAVYSVAGTLAYGSDIVLVGLLLNPRAAAAYAIAIRAFGFMQRLAMGVLGALGPVHAHAAQHATQERRFQLYSMTTYVTLSIALCTALTVGTFAGPLLSLWLGTVPPHSETILTILCAVAILAVPGMSAASVVLNSERAGELMLVTVASAILNIVLSIGLTIAVGNIGPALGSLIAVALADFLYMPRRVSHMLGRTYGDIIRSAARPLLFPASVLVAILLTGKTLLPEGLWFLAVAGSAAAVFFGMLWNLPYGREIRAILRKRDPALATTAPPA